MFSMYRPSVFRCKGRRGVCTRSTVDVVDVLLLLLLLLWLRVT